MSRISSLLHYKYKTRRNSKHITRRQHIPGDAVTAVVVRVNDYGHCIARDDASNATLGFFLNKVNGYSGEKPESVGIYPGAKIKVKIHEHFVKQVFTQ